MKSNILHTCKTVDRSRSSPYIVQSLQPRYRGEICEACSLSGVGRHARVPDGESSLINTTLFILIDLDVPYKMSLAFTVIDFV